MQQAHFHVKGVLANRHVQSMLASSKLRKRMHSNKHKDLVDHQKDVILNAGDDVQLHCLYSENKQTKNKNKLVILIHGWEGSAESTYLLSAASCLYNEGFSVIRFHLRDHGPSSHLNTELFHAARLDEVLNALQDIQYRFNYEKTYLAGFSLGGNFALRVGQKADEFALNLSHIVAISPVFSPAETMAALENGSVIYRQYFIKKWKRALETKAKHFPELYDFSSLLASKNLNDMTHILITEQTPFDSVQDYFNSYTLSPDSVKHSSIKTDLIIAADDPVIPSNCSAQFSSTDTFKLRVFAHGGHCGFIQNWCLESWVDRELLSLFSSD